MNMLHKTTILAFTIKPPEEAIRLICLNRIRLLLRLLTLLGGLGSFATRGYFDYLGD